LLCYNFYYREIANYASSYYDQTAFLNEAYSLQEKILTNGFSELWNAVWSPQHFSGLALPIEGALAGLLLPGARLPQLALAFVVFCTLQFVTFSTAKKIWNSSAYGYMALGLILCQVSPWNGAGGLFDFARFLRLLSLRHLGMDGHAVGKLLTAGGNRCQFIGAC
jgi:hypothetical protein